MTFSVSTDSEPSTLRVECEVRWRTEDIVARIWRKDPTVWADPPLPEIADRLGWLDAPSRSRSLLSRIEELHQAAIESGITDVVLCGMGGSSLAPEVFAATLPLTPSSPKLTVLDSTHPDAVRSVNAAINPATTWFIVASKSGTTIETMAFLDFFWEQATLVLPDPGSHFIAITDAGTNLESVATEKGFRAIVLADPDVGGRFSALTAFGLVPAGLIGADLDALLDAAERGAARCSPDISLAENVGFEVGTWLSGLVQDSSGGRISFVHVIGSTPEASIGVWIEQLLAESTGKEGVGIIPVIGGPRINACQRTTTITIGACGAEEADVEIRLDDPNDIGAVMFILEFATAVAGEILAINPFSQPDVEISKKFARAAMASTPGSRSQIPISVDDPEWIRSLTAHLSGSLPPYVAIQAYLPRESDTDADLDALRRIITTSLGVYTTTGYGPRFLHSTGQLHKGGPPGGIFLQIVDSATTNLAIPGTEHTFKQLIDAQTNGDRAALLERGRLVLTVHVGDVRASGLATLVQHVRVALLSPMAGREG